MHFSHVYLAHADKTILRDIDLSIDAGEFVFLIGASGSGKTSFIKSMIGDFWPKSGTVYDGRKDDIYKKSKKDLLRYRRSIGVIFQDFRLLEKKTVSENVAFAMEVSGYSDEAIKERVPEVLKEVGLLGKANTWVEELSGGELQRVAIARALIHHPDIIIGDEPTGNLDPKNTKDIMAILEKLSKEGKTIIIATHDDRIVDTMKRRVIHFAENRVVSDEKIGSYRY